ncbi:MAG TPA: hypothetical protein VKY74_09760 [Chloroflexia bacterium]|nr:hypothetical protein [Chloroflexia bacterium]
MSAILDPAGSKLLVDESPLIVLPQLAAAIGLPEALMLQQIHYWLRTAGKPRDGALWIYNSYAEWRVQLPFWTVSTLRRVLLHLRAQGLIRTATYNARPNDRTLWYTIDYAAVAALGVPLGSAATSHPPAAISSPPAAISSPPAAIGSPPVAIGSPPVETGNWSAQNGRSSAETDRPGAESSRPGAENGRPCAGFEPPLPETTTKTTSESNTETPESVCTPARSAIDSFTVTEPLLSWWASERTAASLGPDAIPLARETDAWRDYLRRAGHRPADLAAHWRQWMRHAIRYYLQRPPAREPVHAGRVPEFDLAAAEARAAESRAAAAQLMAAVRAIPRPQRAAG